MSLNDKIFFIKKSPTSSLQKAFWNHSFSDEIKNYNLNLWKKYLIFSEDYDEKISLCAKKLLKDDIRINKRFLKFHIKDYNL